MKKGASSIKVKRLNRNRVFRYLNSRERTSMPDIAEALGMSGPTVLQIIRELKELQIAQEVGEFRSTGGRKAKAIASVRNACYAAGLDITRNHLSLVITDLSEKVLKHVRIREPFTCSDNYFRKIGTLLEAFIDENKVPRQKVTGVGLSIPGIVDQEGNISYSHTLDLEHVDGSRFVKYIPYPCTMLNDANAAVIAECSGKDVPRSMIYLSLSNSVGGAIVFRQNPLPEGLLDMQDSVFRKIYRGDNQRAGEFGHMEIHPDGPVCYCGKKGCLDVYCSALRLADLTDGNLGRFFEEMEAGNQKWRSIWEEYLDHLVLAVDNLRMCFDGDVVLGGYVGSYMEHYMDGIRARCAKRNIFGHTGEYVRACRYRIEASALGAAIFQIEKYIDEILDFLSINFQRKPEKIRKA